MVRVPTYQIGQIEERALPDVAVSPNASPESFGAGEARAFSIAGQGLSQLGAEVRQYAFESKQRKDKAVVRNQLNSARTETRKYMANVYSLQGEEAINVYGEVEKNLTDIRKKYSSALKDPSQREMFSATYDGLMTGNLDRALSFQEKQRVNFEKATIEAENQNAVEDAVASRTDPIAIDNSEAEIVANTRFANKGMGSTVINQKVEEAVHNLHLQVLKNLTSDSPEAALGYMESNWDKFDRTVRGEMKTEIQNLAKKSMARDTAIELANSGLGYEEQLKAVDEIKDQVVADDVRKRVKARHLEATAIQKAKENKYVEKEYDQLFRDPLAYQVPIEDVPADVQKDMQAYKDKAYKNTIGQDSDTNWALYYDLKSNKDKLMALDGKLHTIKDQLNDAEFKELTKDQLAYKQGKKDETTTVLTTKQMIDKNLAAVGISPTPRKGRLGKKDAETVALFYKRFNSELISFENEYRRKATYDEKQKIIDRLLIQGEVKGGFFMDPDKRFFEVEEGDEFFIDDIPQEEKAQIVEALKAKGLPVTQDAINALYTKVVLSGE